MFRGCLVLLLLICCGSSTTTLAWSASSPSWKAEWIPTTKNPRDDDHRKRIDPPRSGHVAFVTQDKKIHIFGGYAEEEEEEENETTGTAMRRYPINDLWVLDSDENSISRGWERVHGPSIDGNDQEMMLIPQQRLAAAAASFVNGEKGFVFGGWDSQQAGSGGVILSDIWEYNDNSQCCWTALSSSSSNDDGVDLGAPTSRLVAVGLNETTIFLHNHRCIQHVLLFQQTEGGGYQVIQQPTTGTAPSPRGLHAAISFPDTHQVVVFGGAAQDGTMSNQVFSLNTKTWEWKELQECVSTSSSSSSKSRPSPRASPCFVALDSKGSALLFGGATPTSTGLHGCQDTWLFELIPEDGGEKNGDSSVQIRWTPLILEEDDDDDSVVIPPGRNAATLVPLANRMVPQLAAGKEEEKDPDGQRSVESSLSHQETTTQYFLLTGGWYPFQTTHAEDFILKVSRT